MADQAINALPTKTAPTTGDKMLMIGAAEEYQIDYDLLATAILNKLTSKTFTLDQGTKSLVAALNELNSKTFIDIGVFDIPYDSYPDKVIEVDYPASARFLYVSYGAKNVNQSYGGATVIIDRNENKPCLLPVYRSRENVGTIYIHNNPSDKKIRIYSTGTSLVFLAIVKYL